MYASSCCRLLAALAALCSFATPVRGEEPPGVLWQTTSQMVMPGMPFTPPPNSLQVCTPKVWTAPPPGGDGSCVNSDFEFDGHRATWTMQCAGDMPMTGTGEMTFEGSDAYSGAINATVDGMPMTIKLSGQKIGTCDNPMAS